VYAKHVSNDDNDDNDDDDVCWGFDLPTRGRSSKLFFTICVVSLLMMRALSGHRPLIWFTAISWWW
jgi:hypothetical protein